MKKFMSGSDKTISGKNSSGPIAAAITTLI